MKRLLFLFATLSISCSNDSDRQSEPTQNCNCSTVKQADTFSLPNGYIWTVATIENDCSGVQSQKNLVGKYLIGDKVCD